MQAIVLVGGEGTRLRPLTLTLPKQMLPVVGVPMLERVLGHLARHGIERAVLSMGYLPDAFREAYPDEVAAGIELSYAIEPEPLDTAGAIRFAAEHGQIDSTFLAVNGDVLSDLDLTALVAFHRDRQADGTIALHPVDDPSAYGVVPTDARGMVTAFVEKPRLGEAPTNLINAGTYVLEPSVLSTISPGHRVSIEREVFPRMARERCLYALGDDAYWLDTGTPVAFLQANFDLVEGRRGGPPSPGSHLVFGDVWAIGSPIVKGTVTGPCWLADGVVVAEGATVHRSVVGPEAIVDRGATVRDSVVFDRAHVEAGATVSGSILGARSVVGERSDVRPLSVVGADTVVPSGKLLDGERLPA